MQGEMIKDIKQENNVNAFLFLLSKAKILLSKSKSYCSLGSNQTKGHTQRQPISVQAFIPTKIPQLVQFK